MSSSACVVFYGLKYEIPPGSVTDLLEERRDPRMLAAKSARLDVYWGNFGGIDERYLLFIGKRLALLGPEDQPEIALSSDELQRLAVEVDQRLEDASFAGSPALHVVWEEDN